MDVSNRSFNFDNKQYYKKNTGPMPCTNCGIIGHTNRQCTNPITSYGIIAFRVKKESWSLRRTLCSDPSGPVMTGYESCGGFEFLMIRRKDSLRFVEFIRGKYDINNVDYLRQMIENMTQIERENLKKHTFDELWQLVWGASTNKGRSYKNDYENSKEKFQQLTECDSSGNCTLFTIIDTTTSPWKEPEWGFPKGRRNPREDDRCAAIREFVEETGIRPYEFELIDNIDPITENFYGDNHVYYCHKYYMAFCTHAVDAKISETDEQMVREIGEIGWFTLDDALNKIRCENVEKREILLRASGFLRNYCPLPSKVF